MTDKQEPVSITKRNLSKVVHEWEETNGKKISEEEWIDFTYKGIFEIETAIVNSFTNCRKLSLSSNTIVKITDIQLKNLEILSLGRNKIKYIRGLDLLGGSLKQLWISYNDIDRLDGLKNLLKLEVLYISNNMISNIDELNILVIFYYYS